MPNTTMSFEKQDVSAWNKEFKKDIAYRAWLLRPTGIDHIHLKINCDENCYYQNKEVIKAIFRDEKLVYRRNKLNEHIDIFSSHPLNSGGEFGIVMDEEGCYQQNTFNPVANEIFISMNIPIEVAKGNYVIVSHRIAEGEEHPRDLPQLTKVTDKELEIIARCFLSRCASTQKDMLDESIRVWRKHVDRSLDKNAKPIEHVSLKMMNTVIDPEKKCVSPRKRISSVKVTNTSPKKRTRK